MNNLMELNTTLFPNPWPIPYSDNPIPTTIRLSAVAELPIRRTGSSITQGMLNPVKLQATPQKMAIIKGFLKTDAKVFKKERIVNVPIEERIQRQLKPRSTTPRRLKTIPQIPKERLFSKHRNGQRETKKSVIGEDTSGTENCSFYRLHFQKISETNRPIKNRMKQAPKNAINSLRSAWLSVNARLDRRRNNIAGRAILKANLERTVLAVLLNPNQRDNANPKKMSRKSGELFPN